MSHWFPMVFGRPPHESFLTSELPYTPTGGKKGGSTSGSPTVLLVGKSGCGKSATGTSQAEMGTWEGRDILVIDTAPIFESKAQNQDTDKDIGDCYLLCAPGPHVLLLVTQLGRFTAEDAMAVRRVKEVFGVGVMRHVIVLFTRKEDLADKSLEEFVTHTDNRSLCSLIQECGGRYCAFNNKASGEEQQGQLAELMALVRRLEQECEGSFHSNDLFLHAEVLRRGGYSEHQDPYRCYLAKVRQELEKQKWELKEQEGSWIAKMLSTVKSCSGSHTAVLALLIVLGLILLTTFISLCIRWLK